MKVMLVDPPLLFAEAMARQPGIELACLTPHAAIPGLPAERHYAFTARAKIDFRAISTLRAAVKEFRPDILHPYYSRPLASAVLGTRLMTDAPAIVGVRAHLRVPSLRDPSEFITYRHPSVRAIACESSAVIDALVKGGIPRERCAPIYFCAPPVPQCTDGRARLVEAGVPQDAFVVGTVATIRPVKGIDILLEAVKQLALPNLRVVLVGPNKDPLVTKMLEDPALAPKVHSLGFRTDPVQLCSGFDLFVMPSRTEAICRALLEAMSQHICPIVSDAGGMKEVVRHGTDGLVVPRENVDALARAIGLMYHNDDARQRFAEAAYERATTEFSPQRMIDRAIEIYRKVLRAKTAAVAA